MVDQDALLAACTTALADPEPRLAVRSLLEAYLADGALGYATDAPEPGIHVLHQAPDLTVLDVVWAPGSAILPHDHRMWAAIAIYDGREDNAFFRRDEGRGAGHVVPSGGRELRAGDQPDAEDLALFGELLGKEVDDPRAAAAELSRGIRSGEFDDRISELAPRLEEHVRRKLEIARPGYDQG